VFFMHRRVFRSSGCAVVVGAWLGAAAAVAQEAAPPLLRVPRLAAPPILDGRLDPAEWGGCAAITGLVLTGAEGALAPPEMQAVFLIGYDNEYLYLAARVPNPSGRYPVGRVVRSDAAAILEDDRFEVMLVPTDRARAGREGQGYFHIAVNPLGAVADRWLNSGSGYREWFWSSGGAAGSTVNAQYWDLELSISLKSLGIEKADGQTLFAQLALSSGDGAEAVRRAWAWAGPRQFERWGQLMLDPQAPAVHLRSLGPVAEGALDAVIEVRGLQPSAVVQARVQLQDAEGRALAGEARESRADPRGTVEMRWQAPHAAISDSGNTLQTEVLVNGTPLFTRSLRVDRWTDAARNRTVKPWLDSRPATPPVEIASPLDNPRSPLAFIAAHARRVLPLEAALTAALQARDRDAAVELARRLTREAPFHPAGFLRLAAFEASAFNTEAALDHLEKAVDRGFNNAAALASAAEFQSLRDLERFQRLLQRASASPGLQISSEVRPAEVTGPTVEVAEDNVTLHPQLRLPIASYRFSAAGAREREITTIAGAAGNLLRQWFQEGTAAGNWGDLYDNRDNGHSRLAARAFPQLTHIRYSALARMAGLDNGLALNILHDGVVIGNASLAITGGPIARSLPRLAHANPQAMALFYLLYRTGKLYVHPAHMDFPRERAADAGLDPARRDAFFTNAPFPLISRGSSGSDRPHLEALAATLAAFHPATKKSLLENGLLMPTLQMLLRRHFAGVAGDDDYLSGKAHPPMFPGADLGLEAMVRAAHAMTPDALPPWAEIRVAEEERLRIGRDYFEAPGRTEEIFTVPVCVARVFRGTAQRRRWVLSAEGCRDVNGKPLTFHWRLLQGDPERVRIRPLDERGERAEIEIAWHPPMPAAWEPNVMSTRADIALFAHNGIHFSAPAFFTVYFPAAEERTYDAQGRIWKVNYTRGHTAPFVDPLIYTPRAWTDEYAYDAEGRMSGWTRTLGQRAERYNAEGRRIGSDGQARDVVYRLVPEGPLARLEPAP